MPEARVKYLGSKMAFEGVSGSGHRVIMDGAPEVGGENQGIRPMETVLVALGGCTGMDVVSILQKMRVPFASFEMNITGHRVDTHPKIYDHITIRYEFQADKDHADKMIRAVTLSQEKYCSVSAMLAKSARIDADIVINGEVVHTLTSHPAASTDHAGTEDRLTSP
ncbi:MAG: OsmC family protein [Firmicutes bacterium]|nr:OsmC family protein [Bacillota bacterium]